MQTRRTWRLGSLPGGWVAALLVLGLWIALEILLATRPSRTLMAHWGGEKSYRETLGGGHGVPSGDVLFEEGMRGFCFHLHEGGRIELPSVEAESMEGLEGFTIEAWIRPEVGSGVPASRWIREGMATAIHLWINRHWRDQGFRQLFEVLLEGEGDWGRLDPRLFTHIAVTHELGSGLARLHLNGKVVAEARLGAFGRTARYPFRLGVEDPAEGRFVGWIDELAMHNRVLTGEEIALSHREGLAGGCRATRGLWLAEMAWPLRAGALAFLAGLSLSLVGRSIRVMSPIAPTVPEAKWSGVRSGLLALGIGMVVTLVATLEVRRRALEHDRESFLQSTRALLDMINTRMELLAQGLESVAAWHGQMRGEMTDALWREHIDAMRLAENFPGMVELGVVEVVPDLERERHLEETRARLGPDYTIRPATLAGREGWSAPVVRHSFATPTNKRHPPYADHGLDLASLPEQRAAVEAAVGSALPTASDCVLFTHLHPSIRGFRLFVGDTRGGLARVGSAGSGDRVARRYLVFCTVDMTVFARALFQTTKPHVEFLIYDHPGGERDHLLRGDYDRWVLQGQGRAAYLSSTEELLNFRNRLYIDFHSLPSFDAGSVRYWPWVVGIVGAALSTLAALGIYSQTRSRDKERVVLLNLRSTHERLQEALRERVRLSRDLHDVVIQTIYAVALSLHACRTLALRDAQKASEELDSNSKELYRVIDLLRGFIANQREDGSPAEPFGAALENLVLGLQRSQAMTLRLEMQPGAAEALEESHGPHLISIAREAISNSFKHSLATEVEVRLDRQNGHVRLMISDNGRGLPRGEPPETCHGLRNMATRAGEIGAAFNIQSMDGRFTTVTVTVPRRKDQSLDGR